MFSFNHIRFENVRLLLEYIQVPNERVLKRIETEKNLYHSYKKEFIILSSSD